MPEPDQTRPPPPPRRWGDRIFRWLCLAAGLSVLITVLGLIFVLVTGAWPALTHAGELQIFTRDLWMPDPPQGSPVFGTLGFIYGTLVTSAIAMLLAVPLGVGAAAFLSEIAPSWLRRAGSFLVELLAAIPSVVYGFWGLAFVAPALQWAIDRVGGPNIAGQGLLPAGVVLAVMILPYITAISFDVCRAVPQSQREAALALGATRWQMIRTSLLPYARPGILAGCFLALGRALGETMAVTMLIGNIPGGRADFSLFGKGDSMASIIANQFKEADDVQHRSALFLMGLVLFAVTAITNVLARWLIKRMGRPRPSRGKAPAPARAVGKTPPPAPQVAVSHRGRVWVDRLMSGVLGATMFLTIIPLFLILGYIVFKGTAALDLTLFTELPKYPGAPQRGLGHAMLGSLIMVGLATVIAVPISVFGGVFLAEYPKHAMAKPVRFLSEQLAAVPSIVIGIFGYAVLVMTTGAKGWAGVFALSVMMLPVVIRSSEEAMKLVPGGLRQASYALGATRWQTVIRVILPAASPAILTGVILAVARVAGETAPLLLTAQGSDFWPGSLSEGTAALPVYIYKYALSDRPEENAQAWSAALVLISFVLLLNVGIRLLAGRRTVSASRAG